MENTLVKSEIKPNTLSNLQFNPTTTVKSEINPNLYQINNKIYRKHINKIEIRLVIKT